MMKKHMVPLSKGGQTIRHQGKGSESADLPDRRAMKSLQSAPNAGMNDYGKVTPAPQGTPGPSGGIPFDIMSMLRGG